MNKSTLIRWTSGMALGMAASAFISTQVGFPAAESKAHSVPGPRIIDPQIAFCRASVDSDGSVIHASVIETATKDTLYKWGGLSPHAVGTPTDSAFAINQKTQTSDLMFHVNKEDWGVSSCDVGHSRYLVLEQK